MVNIVVGPGSIDIKRAKFKTIYGITFTANDTGKILYTRADFHSLFGGRCDVILDG